MNAIAHAFPSDNSALAARLELLAQHSAQAICPEILLHLNVSVFRQLRKLDTPRARICAVLNLSDAEYDYVDALT